MPTWHWKIWHRFGGPNSQAHGIPSHLDSSRIRNRCGHSILLWYFEHNLQGSWRGAPWQRQHNFDKCWLQERCRHLEHLQVWCVLSAKILMYKLIPSSWIFLVLPTDSGLVCVHSRGGPDWESQSKGSWLRWGYWLRAEASHRLCSKNWLISVSETSSVGGTTMYGYNGHDIIRILFCPLISQVH